MEQSQDKLRVAVAGCHRMTHRTPGSHNFAAAFHAVPETDVAAVFDLGADTRTEFADCWREVWGDVPTYHDYGQMLGEIQPDLLCLATRQTMHADQIELAVQAGVRGILCDKPLVTSLAELDRIVAACQEVPLLLAIGPSLDAPLLRATRASCRWDNRGGHKCYRLCTVQPD